MRLQRVGERLQLRLESGDRVSESLIALLNSEQIGYASITGLGALRWVSLAYWNPQARQYDSHEFDEQVEVVSLVGNATLRGGQPALHLHASLGRRDLSLFGGHFNDGIAHPTLEVWLSPEPATVTREVEPDSGLPLMQLPDRPRD